MLLKDFLWTSFAEWKFLNGDYSGLESIFGESLKTIYSVKLWRLYLVYIRTARLLGKTDEAEIVQGRQILFKAYESAVAHVGLDVESFPIWWEYLEFVKNQSVLSIFLH